MKIILLILFLTSNIVFSQQKIVEYQLYSINNSKEKMSPELKAMFKDESDTILLNLVSSPTEGSFFAEDKIDNSQTFQIDIIRIFVKSQGSYYFDISNQKVQNLREFSQKTHIIEYQYNEIDWEITAEVEEIAGYPCTKAIHRVKEDGIKGEKELVTTVWFTDKIDLKVAPFGLTGLNGLILKIDFYGKYELKFNQIIENTKVKIKPLKNGKIISLQEYRDFIKDFNKKRIERYKNQSIEFE